MKLFIFMLVLASVDIICYGLSKYPERRKWYYRFLPFGGVFALLKYGKDK